jgi:hypothetical protein
MNLKMSGEKFINPLKKFKPEIISLSDDFPRYLTDKLKMHNFHWNETVTERAKKESWIDWHKYPDHHSFYFDFKNNEDVVKKYLLNSKLNEYDFVIMEFGYQAPISRIPLNIFINYWYELVIIAGYETVVLTEDGKLFMEFLRRDYLLKSNFLIMPPSDRLALRERLLQLS